MRDKHRHYGKWTREELRQAESTASRYLAENGEAIAEVMRAKTKFLEPLFQRIAKPNITFEQRMEYLARISEVAGLIQEDADGFFELASQPTVARILGTVSRKLG